MSKFENLPKFENQVKLIFEKKSLLFFSKIDLTWFSIFYQNFENLPMVNLAISAKLTKNGLNSIFDVLSKFQSISTKLLRTFYAFSFSFYYSSKLTLFLLLQCCHFVNFVTDDRHLLEQQLIYKFESFLCTDNNFVAKKHFFQSRIWSKFLKLCF